ncbi:hypothetical protein [Roseovarius sp. SYSU LYC5161]|uniref:hypothetical protein n=1 Tax=Roseovarius halophilus (ex Wu et al. 2025) TaxID=3376060 RepID=UPI003999F3D1
MMLDDVTLTTDGDRDRIEYCGTACTVQPNPRYGEAVRKLTANMMTRPGMTRGEARRRAEREIDAWSFSVPRPAGDDPDNTGPRTFTAPTRATARHHCRRWFVDAGIITVPTDNAHLDATDRAVAGRLEDARRRMVGPRVGDFVMLPGQAAPVTRICGFSFDGERFGLTHGGSFSLPALGAPARDPALEARAGYSGGFDWCDEWRLDRLADSGQIVRGRFWFFSHGQPGAGRGVDVSLDAQVFDLGDT